jgi:hypothetical protein
MSTMNQAAMVSKAMEQIETLIERSLVDHDATLLGFAGGIAAEWAGAAESCGASIAAEWAKLSEQFGWARGVFGERIFA